MIDAGVVVDNGPPNGGAQLSGSRTDGVGVSGGVAGGAAADAGGAVGVATGAGVAAGDGVASAGGDAAGDAGAGADVKVASAVDSATQKCIDGRRDADDERRENQYRKVKNIVDSLVWH